METDDWDEYVPDRNRLSDEEIRDLREKPWDRTDPKAIPPVLEKDEVWGPMLRKDRRLGDDE